MLPGHSSVVKKKTSVSVGKRTEVLLYHESGMCPSVLAKTLHSVLQAWLPSLGAGAAEETERPGVLPPVASVYFSVWTLGQRTWEMFLSIKPFNDEVCVPTLVSQKLSDDHVWTVW